MDGGGGKAQKQKRCVLKISPIWRYFKQNDEGYTICSLCGKTLKFRSSTHKHLRKQHEAEYKSIYEEMQQISTYKKKKLDAPTTSGNSQAGPLQIAVGNEAATTSNQAQDSEAPRRLSCAWNCFESLEDGRNKCLFCDAIIKSGTRSTSNLLSHLKCSHREMYDEVKHDRSKRAQMPVNAERTKAAFQPILFSSSEEDETFESFSPVRNFGVQQTDKKRKRNELKRSSKATKTDRHSKVENAKNQSDENSPTSSAKESIPKSLQDCSSTLADCASLQQVNNVTIFGSPLASLSDCESGSTSSSSSSSSSASSYLTRQCWKNDGLITSASNYDEADQNTAPPSNATAMPPGNADDSQQSQRECSPKSDAETADEEEPIPWSLAKLADYVRRNRR